MARRGLSSSPADIFPKITPSRIATLDKREFPLAIPALQHLFALDGRLDAVMRFEEHEDLDGVALREPIHNAMAMLVDAPHQTVRHTDVARSAALTRHDVAENGSTSCRERGFKNV